VRDRLAGQGFDGAFLDFHPEDGIPAGANWEAELYAQLKRCVAVVYLGSRASAESRWCFAELALARSLGKPIFPLRIEAGAKQPLVDDLQWTDVAAEQDGAYERLWNGMGRQGLDPEAAFAWRADRAPYPGLDSFQEADAAVFFGRREESQALFERVANTLLQSHERFVAVIGPSGSGKSSLVRAGLIPRLKREGAPWLIAPPFVPQDSPLEMLARSLSQTFTALGRDAPWRAVAAELTAQPGGLKSIARDLLDLAGGEHRALVLFVDQGEELVTLSSAGARAEFARLVSEALTGPSALRVVTTLRSEFLTGALHETELASLLAEPFLLGPLPRSRLPTVVAGPAEIAGIELAPGLVERIVEDTGGGDALPLMAFTMRRLYQRLQVDGDARRRERIEEADYVAVGGVDGALRQRATEVREELDRAGLEAAIIPTLLKLVALEQEAAPTRRRIRLGELSADERAVLQAFIDARLVATDRAGDDAVAYVAHEALLRVWQPLADAVAGHVDELRERSRLERDAREWDESGRDDGYLLRGERLEESLHRLGPTGDERSLLTAFLSASKALRDRAIAREADLLANRIIGEYDEDAERAMLVARAAIEAYGPRPRLQLALSYAVHAPGRRVRIQREGLGSLALSPDGGTMAAGGYPGALLVADVSGVRWERREQPAQQFGGIAVTALAFARLGEYLAVASRDQPRIDILAAESGEPVATLDLGEPVTALAASEDLIVAGGSDGRLRIWSAAPPFALRYELRSVGAIGALEIDDWQYVIAVAAQRTGFVVRLDYKFVHAGEDVEPETSERAMVSEDIRIVRLSPDGHRMLTVQKDARTVEVWSVDGERAAASQLEIDTGEYVGGALWRGDGSRIVTANWRAGVKAWDARTGASVGRPIAGDPGSNLIAGSRDGVRLATLDNDGVLSLWDARGPGPRLRVRLGNAFQTARMACDDRVLVTRGGGLALAEDLKVRDARTGRELNSVAAPRAVVGGMTISPDGRMVAIVDDSGVVCYALPELERVRHLPLDECNHVIFDPTRPGDLITANFDGVIERWTDAGAQTIARVGDFYAGSLDVTPDGSGILVAKAQLGSDGGGVSLLDANTGATRFTRKTEEKTGDLRACIAPDGSCIAIGQSGSLRTIALDGSELVEFAWGSYNIGSAWAAQVGQMTFAPDGRRLATATAEGWVYVWDVVTGELIALLPVDNEPLKDVAFSCDGNELVVCTAEFTGEYDSTGYAEIWPCPSLDELLGLAGHRTFREISDEELAAYGLADEYGARSAASTFHLTRRQR
jgi:WD40 repeat protein